jgi:hypothetical protein
MTDIIVTITRDYGGGSSLIKEITDKKSETALTNKISPKAEAKIMSGDNTKIKNRQKKRTIDLLTQKVNRIRNKKASFLINMYR